MTNTEPLPLEGDTDPLVCLLGPLALTGPQLDFVTERRHQGPDAPQTQHAVLLQLLEEADWDLTEPERRTLRPYQTQGEMRIPPWMVGAAWCELGQETTDATTLRQRINDVLCAAIDDALGDGQQDGP